MNPIQQAVSRLTIERSPTPELISFTAIRRAIGILGMGLPLSLLLGAWLFGGGCIVQPSVSHYYYTNMREVFVGVICSVSLFLFTYKGHCRLDSLLANAGGIFALGIAIFPTDIIRDYPCQRPVASVFQISFHNAIHYACAGFFFVTLACMALFLFTKSNLPRKLLGPRKKKRNLTYKVCGWVMLASIAVVAISKPLLKIPEANRITFWMESVALIAFGIAWLTKGEVLFGDAASSSSRAV